MRTDIFRPEQWHDFFVMVGTGAAALTGLVFVAMSLNPTEIARDATHRYRSIGTLSGLVAVFIICAMALMGGQDHRAIGFEWAILAAVAGVIYFGGAVRSVVEGGTTEAQSNTRVVVGTLLYSAEIIGAIAFAVGHLWGIYVAAISMVLFFCLTVSGAWLLIMKVPHSET